MHALILGATGPAGQALVRQLRGGGPPVEVSVVSRTATDLAGAVRMLTGHYGDLAGTGEFRQWLEGADAVVHLADGLSILQQARLAADAALAERLRAASTRLAVAVREAGVPLLVYVSSIKAICDEDDERLLVEGATPRSTTLYGRSKLQLERTLAAVLAGSATRLAIVRNPVLYGPGKAGSLDRLLRLAATPLPLPLGGLGNRRSVLAICNLASALAAIVRAGPGDAPGAAAGTFHVHDGPALSTTEIVAALRDALGRPRRLFPPGDAGRAVARRLPLLAPAARRLYGSLEMSDARFRAAFRWTPPMETRAALAEMAVHAP
jgi:nucleoside-diphosphate-sugar epimerase